MVLIHISIIKMITDLLIQKLIIGQTSNAVGTLSNISTGSPNITNRYFFDNGLRDGFYDLSKLILRPGEPTPNNQILIVFDYFQGQVLEISLT